MTFAYKQIRYILALQNETLSDFCKNGTKVQYDAIILKYVTKKYNLLYNY